jgi:hypothetical protein
MKGTVHRIVFLSAAVLLSIGTMAYPAGIDMREGEWRISSETSMNMKGMSMPPMVDESTYCLTREDPVPKGKKESECRVVRHRVIGNRVSWRIECKEGEGEGEITYHGTTYKGFFKMKSTGSGETMTMDMKLAGKYLGPCPKGQKSGPTGKTAERMKMAEEMSARGRADAEKGKAQAEQAQAQAKKAHEEQLALSRKAEEIVKRTKVPAEDPGSFAQEGFAIKRECTEALGNNVPEPGYYRLKIEKATEMPGNMYHLDKVQYEEILLDGKSPVPGRMQPNGTAAVKCGKGKITWTFSEGEAAGKGGIVYKGKSIDGATRNTVGHESGKKVTEVVKVSGQWIGGRDYSSRAGGDTGGAATGTLKDKLKNPVKGIRNLFGF